MNYLNQAAAAALAVIRQALAVGVIYRRGADAVSVPATATLSRFDVTDPREGMLTTLDVRDYLVASADLVLGGEATEPAEGDLIEETDPDSGVTRVHEVLAPGGAEPAWRYSDPGRTQLRIHTKLVSESGPAPP